MQKPNRRSAYRCLTFAAALASTSALTPPPVVAADLPVKSRTDIVVAPSWTGYYIGAHGGWGWATTQFEDPGFTPPFNPQETTTNGPIAGLQLGANWQYGNVVVGLEVDGSWASLRTSTGRTGVITSTVGSGVNFRALATATARVGYAMGPWLAYAKAGGAWANIEITTSFAPEPTVYERNRFGATGGVGMEVMFLRNVSAKLEYNFLYFPEEQLAWWQPTPTTSIDHYVNLVKGGINVRFGGDHVVARY
jgi:opacity protein-like surface antigen